MPCGFCGRVRSLFRVERRGRDEVVGEADSRTSSGRDIPGSRRPPSRTWPHLAIGPVEEGEPRDYRGG